MLYTYYLFPYLILTLIILILLHIYMKNSSNIIKCHYYANLMTSFLSKNRFTLKKSIYKLYLKKSV